MSPLESGLVISVRHLLPALVLSLPLLAVDPAKLLVVTMLHLTLIVSGSFWLSLRLAELTDETWVSTNRHSRVASASTAVALVTGYAALVTLASSAALRYDPSLQFLQLLSAMDIAWVVAATVIGVRWRWGRGASRLAGGLLAAVCVWSIWRYLDTVGFGPDGEWVVSGDLLARLVIPFDVVAAVIAIGALLIGARHATEQPSPQS